MTLNYKLMFCACQGVKAGRLCRL